MSNVLTVEGAHKQFKKTTALDGAELTLRQGELLALLGPNGAGKTTLLRSISGRVRLDQGAATLLGATLAPLETPQDHLQAKTARKRLGVTPQEIAIYPTLTARENLRFFAELCGVAKSDIEERTRWALDWMGLSDRADDLTKTYSGGMKRRLNIGCSVVHRPEVLLLDEPTAGVDPQSRERIWEMLGELRRDGTSLLLTTHLLDEAQQVADRITIIDHGRTIADGAFDELARQTIGTRRRVILHFDGEPPALPPESGFQIERGRCFHHVDDVVQDLPKILEKAHTYGVSVGDLHIESPTLQAVFIHLTGRELRD